VDVGRANAVLLDEALRRPERRVVDPDRRMDLVLGLRRRPGFAETVDHAVEVATVGADHRPVAVLAVEDAVTAPEAAPDGQRCDDARERLPPPALLDLADRPGLRHGAEVLV